MEFRLDTVPHKPRICCITRSAKQLVTVAQQEITDGSILEKVLTFITDDCCLQVAVPVIKTFLCIIPRKTPSGIEVILQTFKLPIIAIALNLAMDNIQFKIAPKLFSCLFLSLSTIAGNMPAVASQPPSKQFIKKDIPIVWILEEWYRKHPNIPSYACVCTQGTCDSSNRWPFRQFRMGSVLPALGAANKNDAERIGFSCGQIDPQGLKGIGS